MSIAEVALHEQQRPAPPATAGWRVLAREARRDTSAVVGGALVALFLFGAVAAPWIAPYEPAAVDFRNRYASPSFDHPLGTDNLGRDVASRLLHGSRLSIGMAVASTAGITALGLGLGLLAGLGGRLGDTLVMRSADVFLALPDLVLALVLVGLLGQGLRNLVIAIVVVRWPPYARVVRGMALTLRERQFVEAARAAGASLPKVAVRHVVPNLVGPVVVLSTLDMGRTLLAVSALSFLGFGAAPPTAEWGAMLVEAKRYFDRAPMLLIYPGAAISLLVLAFNLVGDGLRDLLDPRTFTRRS